MAHTAAGSLHIAQDLYYYSLQEQGDNVNYIAHISGAGIGMVMGRVYRFTKRNYLHALT